MVPKELHLKIVGIVETEPAAGYGGIGNARLLIPLDTASTLRAAQVNDLRDIVRGSTATKVVYPSLSVRAKSPSQVEAFWKLPSRISASTRFLCWMLRNRCRFFSRV